MTETNSANDGAKQADLPRELFGQIVLRKGFISEDQLDAALARQKQIVENGEKHKLLGLVMIELDYLSNSQLIEILKYLEAKSGQQVE